MKLITPSIAQLVERWTVVVNCQKSIGRWFKSGSKEEIFLFNKNSLKLVGSAFDKKGTHSWLKSQQMLPKMNLRAIRKLFPLLCGAPVTGGPPLLARAL